MNFHCLPGFVFCTSEFFCETDYMYICKFIDKLILLSIKTIVIIHNYSIFVIIYLFNNSYVCL